MDATPGMMVGEDVELVRPLDEGGMGEVWVGRHVVSKMEVAVKFVHEELAQQDPTLLDRFRREAAVLRQVRSPHVVRMIEQDTLPDGTLYLIMELLRGETLVERLERTEAALSLEQAGKLLDQFVEALEIAHQLGIVHRDLKGENVYLVGDGDQLCLKVLDFGCAKTPDMPGHPKLTAPGVLVGSPEYMSPEQIVSAGEVDHHADLWAVAVLTYMATLLALPFQGERLSEVFGAVRTGEFVAPSKLRPDTPTGVDAWFTRAFSTDRTARFSSVSQMRDAWHAAIRHGAAGPSKALVLSLVAGAVLLLVVVIYAVVS